MPYRFSRECVVETTVWRPETNVCSFTQYIFVTLGDSLGDTVSDRLQFLWMIKVFISVIIYLNCLRDGNTK